MNAIADERALRILAVEDDPGVRRLLVSTLGGAGYEVRVASTAEEALEIVGSLDRLDVLRRRPGGHSTAPGGGVSAQALHSIRS